jgi:hypothetical protein
MKNQKNMIIALAFVPAIVFSSCDNDSNTPEMEATGTARLEATDAAVDARNITGVFLSVEEAQFVANGQIENSITYESPQLFNLMDYQNGSTFAMGEATLSAGTYDQVRLILSSSTQAFVEFTNGASEEVEVPSGSTSGYKINGDFEILANGISNVIVDVDLRKALIQEGNGGFRLRPTARLTSRENTGMIRGELDENQQSTDRVVVFAYAEGTFSDSEMNEPAQGSSRFEGAINSATVDASGNFTLAFMPEGEYELIVAKYEENESENSFEFSSATSIDVTIGGELTGVISVEANTMTTLVLDLF